MTITTFANPICVALDSSDRVAISSVARATRDHVGLFKVGLTSYITFGRDLVAELALERPVFLDLKLHDIPIQVAGAVEAVAQTGAAFTTVHATGGAEMIRAAVDAAGPVAILAVTVLTSLDDAALAAMGLPAADELVMAVAEVALGAGAAGLVCSPLEVAGLRRRFGARDAGGPLLVVPGIRATAEGDDQKRTATATQALAAGADVVVVGRPITQAPDPAAAARALAAGLNRHFDKERLQTPESDASK